MNYYNEIKNKLIDNEVYKKVKDYSKNRNDLSTYYEVGKLLIKAQGGEGRAKYGDNLIKEYYERLFNDTGRKYNITALKRIRQFYLVVEKGVPLAHQLTWSHYCELLPLKDINEINYYVKITIEQCQKIYQLQKKSLKELEKEKKKIQISYFKIKTHYDCDIIITGCGYMSKESKLYLFRDRKDYIKKMTNDDVINVIGTKGSGKTTSTLKYINDDNYIVINCDRLYEMPTDKVVEDKYLTEIKVFLKNKYGKICEGEEFVNCYNDILDFIKSKKKKALIEGNVIYDIKPITLLKGTVIVKRTGIIKCFVRAVKRDYPIKYFMNQEIEKHGKILGRFYRLKNIIKRRKNIFKIYHEIENIIDALETYKND